MKKLFLLAKKPLQLMLLLLFLSCSDDKPVVDGSQDLATAPLSRNGTKVKMFKGPVMSLGDGTVRSYVSMNADGFPLEIGIEMSHDALENLPMHAEEHELVLRLHHHAREATPFDHILINWNPEGHEPTGVFSVPHFDFHFYMMPLAERVQIPAWSPTTDAAFNNYPPEGYMPATYFTPPGAGTAEPRMGKHWLPVNLGEFLPFSKIMILGSYDGEVTFIEPMITLDHLLSETDSSEAYPQPASFAEAGNYPTKYNIHHDMQTGHIHITLSDFVARN